MKGNENNQISDETNEQDPLLHCKVSFRKMCQMCKMCHILKTANCSYVGLIELNKLLIYTHSRPQEIRLFNSADPDR